MVFVLITINVDLHLIIISFFLSSFFLTNAHSQMSLSQV